MGPFDYSISQFGIKDTSNTDVLWYAGDLMTLWYNAGNPYRLDSQSLETRGPYPLEGRNQLRMSAHSKVDWSTGELLFRGWGRAASGITAPVFLVARLYSHPRVAAIAIARKMTAM